MKITTLGLHHLVKSILSEGKAEDLVSSHPQLKQVYDRGIVNHNYLLWLLKMEKFEPVADTMGLIPSFEQHKQRLAVKDINGYRNPGDLRLALEDLDKSKGEQRRQLRDNETDIVYESDQWLVVMPHTMESSIHWGRGTTWCTAATQSGNLFYTYVGKKEEDIVLYYIIKKRSDSKLDPNAKLSVGFIDGKPTLDGEGGGLSVNALNVGLTKSSLDIILGEESNPIIKSMKSYSKKIQGKHPAKVEMQKIAQSKDPSVIDRYTSGMDEEQRSAFLSEFLNYDLSLEMLSHLANDKEPSVRSRVAHNTGMTPKLLALLASDEDENTRAAAAGNPNISPESLDILIRDEDEIVRSNASRNPRLSPELMTHLINDKKLKSGIARNSSVTIEALAILAKDEDSVTRTLVATNLKTPPELLSLLARDEDEWVRVGVAERPDISPEDFAILAKDRSSNTRGAVARNRNTPPELLTLLARDEDEWVKSSVVQSPNAPPEALDILRRDKSVHVRSFFASSPKSTSGDLDILANDKEMLVRRNVASNPKAPLSALNRLVKDEEPSVRLTAADNNTYKEYLASQNQLAERWLRISGLRH